jgi:hypothetical protein
VARCAATEDALRTAPSAEPMLDRVVAVCDQVRPVPRQALGAEPLRVLGQPVMCVPAGISRGQHYAAYVSYKSGPSSSSTGPYSSCHRRQNSSKCASST